MTKSSYTLARRRLLSAAGAALAAPYVLRRARAADTPLIVSSYGGSFEEALELAIYPIFKQETGINITSVSQSGGNSWFDSLRLSQESDIAQVDVTMCGWQGAAGWSDLLVPIEVNNVPNIASVPDYLVHKTDDGQTDAVAVLAWFSTFVTNSEAFLDPPVSWADAWDPKFRQAMGWNGVIDSSYLLDIVARTFFDGRTSLESADGLEACIKKAAELKSNVALWYRDEDEFQVKLKSGSLTAGQFYHDVTRIMEHDGFPIRSTFPKEGGVIDFGSWAIIKNTKMKEEAEAFINFCLRPDIQSEITRHLWTAPVIPKSLTNLTDDEFRNASSEVAPIVPYYELYETRGHAIVERWQEYMQGLA